MILNTLKHIFVSQCIIYTLKNYHLRFRIVQTQAILFLKSMSERVGSDMQRNSMMNFYIESKYIADDIIKINLFMSDPTLSDIDFKN